MLRAWGNPPGRETLGMLVPGVHVLTPEGWGVIISFSEDGYVKDDDAAKIDYRELLRTMQQATRDANPERAKAGYATVELVGWAEAPRYDSVAPKLYWASDRLRRVQRGSSLRGPHPGTDKVAEYGIAALIAGGLAAKAGLFKVLLGALVALKKVIVLGFVAAAAFLRKLFGRKPTDAAAKP